MAQDIEALIGQFKSNANAIKDLVEESKKEGFAREKSLGALEGTLSHVGGLLSEVPLAAFGIAQLAKGVGKLKDKKTEKENKDSNKETAKESKLSRETQVQSKSTLERMEVQLAKIAQVMLSNNKVSKVAREKQRREDVRFRRRRKGAPVNVTNLNNEGIIEAIENNEGLTTLTYGMGRLLEHGLMGDSAKGRALAGVLFKWGKDIEGGKIEGLESKQGISTYEGKIISELSVSEIEKLNANIKESNEKNNEDKPLYINIEDFMKKQKNALGNENLSDKQKEARNKALDSVRKQLDHIVVNFGSTRHIKRITSRMADYFDKGFVGSAVNSLVGMSKKQFNKFMKDEKTGGIWSDITSPIRKLLSWSTGDKSSIDMPNLDRMEEQGRYTESGTGSPTGDYIASTDVDILYELKFIRDNTNDIDVSIKKLLNFFVSKDKAPNPEDVYGRSSKFDPQVSREKDITLVNTEKWVSLIKVNSDEVVWSLKKIYGMLKVWRKEEKSDRIKDRRQDELERRKDNRPKIQPIAKESKKSGGLFAGVGNLLKDHWGKIAVGGVLGWAVISDLVKGLFAGAVGFGKMLLGLGKGVLVPLLTTPMGLAVVAGAIALWYFWDEVKGVGEKISKWWSDLDIKAMLNDVWDDIVAGVKSALTIDVNNTAAGVAHEQGWGDEYDATINKNNYSRFRTNFPFNTGEYIPKYDEWMKMGKPSNYDDYKLLQEANPEWLIQRELDKSLKANKLRPFQSSQESILLDPNDEGLLIIGDTKNKGQEHPGEGWQDDVYPVQTPITQINKAGDILFNGSQSPGGSSGSNNARRQGFREGANSTAH